MGLCTICTMTLPKAIAMLQEVVTYVDFSSSYVEIPCAVRLSSRTRKIAVSRLCLLSYPTTRPCAHCRSCTGWRDELCLRLLVSGARKGVCDGGAWSGSSPHAPLCQPWLGPKLLPKVQVNVRSRSNTSSQVVMILSLSCRVSCRASRTMNRKIPPQEGVCTFAVAVVVHMFVLFRMQQVMERSV